jgi:hypothetical protein
MRSAAKPAGELILALGAKDFVANDRLSGTLREPVASLHADTVANDNSVAQKRIDRDPFMKVLLINQGI